MYIQKIKYIDENLESQVINMPLENNEKIISYEPYFLDVVNAYRETIGGSTLSDIGLFENSKNDTLIENVKVRKDSDKFSVSINAKYDCTIPLDKESEDVKKSFDEGVVYKIPISANFKNGISVSIKDSLKLATKNELKNAAITKNMSSAYKAHIDERISGGYFVTIQGVKCFMPGSTASYYKLSDFDSILGIDMMVVPIMYNSNRDMTVVSHVAFLEAIKPNVLNSVMNNDKKTEYNGIVTMKKHDYLLITFNECLAGKLIYADMDETTKRMFNANEIETEKTEISFKIDQEYNGQLLLTQTWKTKQIWDEHISKEFKPGMTLDGVILGASKKSILIQLKYNVVGILPVIITYNIGEHINVKITSIDIDNRKIKLNLC